MFDDIADVVEGSTGESVVLTERDHFVDGQFLQLRPDDGHEFVVVFLSELLRIVLENGLVLDDFDDEGFPAAAQDTQHDLSVIHVEQFVRNTSLMAGPGRLWILSGDSVHRDVLLHERDDRSEEIGFDVLAASVPVPLVERCEDRDRQVEACTDITDCLPDFHRFTALGVGDAHDSTFRLHHQIDALPVLLWALLAVALDRTVDQFRIDLCQQVLVTQSEPLHYLGTVVLDEDVCISDQSLSDLPTLLVLQIERDALLISIPGDEVYAHPILFGVASAGRITDPRPFDLDYLRTQLTENLGTPWTDTHATKIDDRQII